MDTVYLKRVSYSKKGTYGVLVYNEVPIAVTLELPWKDNSPNVSCIPCGMYSVERYDSAKFGRCLKLMDVPNRYGILIHSGNTLSDSEGCILVGSMFEGDAVSHSKYALGLLLAKLPSKFVLDIILTEEY